MPPAGGDLNFHEYGSDYNPAAKTTPFLAPDLMIQINRHLKIHGNMSH